MSEVKPETAVQDRRIVRRRPLKKGVTLTVRRGAMGLGPNLALSTVELSDDGIQVRVKVEFKKGDEIEIGLTAVGKSKPMLLMADVRWCRAVDENREEFLLGAKLRKRLLYADVSQYV